MKKEKIWLILLLVFVTFTCVGCMTPTEIYEASKKYDVTDEELKALAEGKLTLSYDREMFDSYWDYVKYQAASIVASGSTNLKAYALPLIGVSIAIGIVLMGIGKHFRAMSLRKFALYVFVIGIPAFIICLIYAAALLADATS